MRQPLAIAALGALASALLYLSFGTGAGGLPLFAYFVQLPLTFVGLALGPVPAGIAGLSASGIVLLFGGWLAALLFVLIQAVPSLLVSRLALLWRADAGGDREWYPTGRLVGHLVLYVIAVSTAGLLLAQYWSGDLARLVATGLYRSLAALTDAPLGEVSAPAPGWLSLLPGLVAASWLLMCCTNALLAQLLAARSGMARRPTPAMATFVVPDWTQLALAAAAAGVLLLDGTGLFLATTALLALTVPYLLQGLAVVHAVVERRGGGRRLPLVLFYLVLLLFSWPLVLVVVLLGLVEDWARLRHRLV